ncbi:MAG TPA: CHRD domain-containing protein [Chitinophagaceae bacterium]|jgi:hypothetical protein|nr:CHRD domain-containing protein [Chitinophagaceae bacterium]
MKTIFFRRNIFALFATTILSVSFIACDKDDNNDDNMDSRSYTTSGNASGSQQNPPVATTGTGTLTGTYNAQTNAWQYSVNWSTLSSAATIVELHGPASAGANGNLLLALTITTPGITGAATGSVSLTEQQEDYLLAGQVYYTVITATNITGEIRGQVTATVQ